MDFIVINNHQSVPVIAIPEIAYNLFLDINTASLEDHAERHCVLYFGYRDGKAIRLICCIADDNQHNIMVSSSTVSSEDMLNSFSAKHLSFESSNVKYTRISELAIQIIHG